MSRALGWAGVGLLAVAIATTSGCSTTRKTSEPQGKSPPETMAPAPPPAPAPAPATPETPPAPPVPPTPPTPPAPPAPGRRPPATQPTPCASTQQCAPGQYCTTESGDCKRPPNCGPNDICPAVCWGQCARRAGSATGAACGSKTCPAGQVCCNQSCGICTPPGGFCTQQICDPGSTPQGP